MPVIEELPALGVAIVGSTFKEVRHPDKPIFYAFCLKMLNQRPIQRVGNVFTTTAPTSSAVSQSRRVTLRLNLI